MINTKKTNTKMTIKDLINVSIFTALYAICFFIIAGVMGILPTTMLFYAAVAGVPCGIIYMYMRAKTPKKGAILVQAAIMGILYFTMGTFWTFSLGIIIGGILAELISYAKNYRSFANNAFGFAVLMTSAWAGMMMPVLLAQEKYVEHILKTGMSENYVNELLSFTSGSMFLLALVLTIVGSYVGAILGKKLLKKHFEKAGII